MKLEPSYNSTKFHNILWMEKIPILSDDPKIDAAYNIFGLWKHPILWKKINWKGWTKKLEECNRLDTFFLTPELQDRYYIPLHQITAEAYLYCNELLLIVNLTWSYTIWISAISTVTVNLIFVNISIHHKPTWVGMF